VYTQSKFKVLTGKLGLPSKATGVSSIIVNGPDGPMPEIAIRSFEVNDNADKLK